MPDICYTLYQFMNYHVFPDFFQLWIRLLPVLAWWILAVALFESEIIKLSWIGAARIAVILLIPWATSEIMRSAWMVVCYSP